MQIIKRPVFTDKMTRRREEHKHYVFSVDSHLTKPEISLLVEKIFSVRVKSVNTCWQQRRRRGTSTRLLRCKRAFITLVNGDNIDYFLLIFF